MKITKTKKGYTTVVKIGRDENGKSRTKRFTAPSKPELLKLVSEFNGDKYNRARRTFLTALDAYIDARKPHRSPSTMRGYQIIRRGLTSRYSAFCGLEIGRIADDDVQRIIDTLFRDGYSPKTVRNWIGLINSVLIAEKCPPAHIIMPQKQPADHPIPTAGEIRMMLCLLHGTPLEVPFNLAILSLRRSEICAVTAADVDRDGILHVSKATVNPDGGGTIVREATKTDTSNRFIQLPPEIADRIRQNGRATNYHPNSLTRAYAEFLQKYKFPPYRLHDCRHFFASFCHSQNVPEADILAAGGWKTASVMKSVYRHSMARSRAGAAIASLSSAR